MNKNTINSTTTELVIGKELIKKLKQTLSKQPLYREGPTIYSRGKNLNYFLNTSNYEPNTYYMGTCIADLKPVK
jgi:hypothetical protein